MRELAHQPHFALEARRELVGRHVALHDLDRRRTLQERVAREVHRRHPALRELALEAVRADAPTRRGPCGGAGKRERRPCGPTRGDDEQHQDQRHGRAHVAKRRIRLVDPDLGDDADAIVGQPAPRADDFGATIVAVGIEQHALERHGVSVPAAISAAATARVNGHSAALAAGCDDASSSRPGSRSLRPNDGFRGTARQHARALHAAHVADLRQERAAFVEGVGLAGLAGPRRAQDALEVAVDVGCDAERRYDVAAGVAHGRLDPGERPRAEEGLRRDEPRVGGERADELRAAREHLRELRRHDPGLCRGTATFGIVEAMMRPLRSTALAAAAFSAASARRTCARHWATSVARAVLGDRCAFARVAQGSPCGRRLPGRAPIARRRHGARR